MTDINEKRDADNAVCEVVSAFRGERSELSVQDTPPLFATDAEAIAMLDTSGVLKQIINLVNAADRRIVAAVYIGAGVERYDGTLAYIGKPVIMAPIYHFEPAINTAVRAIERALGRYLANIAEAAKAQQEGRMQ